MKVAIIGLDCLDPELLFEDLLDELPTLKALTEQGIHGPIRSSDPPVTVPAWSVFATGKNPGRLGFTGFKNRRLRETPDGYAGDYDDAFLATSQHVSEPRLWDLVNDAGDPAVCLGVPQTYPPPTINGALVSGLLTPNTDSDWTHPPELADEIETLVEAYPFDLPEASTQDPATLAQTLTQDTAKRFQVAQHLAQTQDWRLFFMVEMGTDRIHHALGPRFDDIDDPTHRDLLRDYYQRLDNHLAELIDTFDDDTAILIVSDHGAKQSKGSIHLNTWLQQEGYLTLTEPLEETTPFDPTHIDWSNTQAWAEGGYVARIHLNVQGREPQGTVDPLHYETLRDEIRTKLEQMPGPHGDPIGTRVLKPQEIYRGDATDTAPDLIAYLGDLHYRADADLGHETLFAPPSQEVHDEAVHDYHGVFILTDPQHRFTGTVNEMTLLDAAPTILDLLGIPIPPDMDGRILRPDGNLHPR